MVKYWIISFYRLPNGNWISYNGTPLLYGQSLLHCDLRMLGFIHQPKYTILTQYHNDCTSKSTSLRRTSSFFCVFSGNFLYFNTPIDRRCVCVLRIVWVIDYIFYIHKLLFYDQMTDVMCGFHIFSFQHFFCLTTFKMIHD